MATVNYLTTDGEIISETRGSVERDYLPDPLGSTSALLDSAQTKTDTFSYWPYGETRTHTGTSVTPFTWVGSQGYYSEPFGSTYIRARTYDVRFCAWDQADPLDPTDRTEGPYSYAVRSPVTYHDASGLIPCNSAEERVCASECRVKMIAQHCSRWKWTCAVAEVYFCGVLVFYSLNCTCECQKCKKPPPSKTVTDPPQARGHYFKALGCCCYGWHTHIIDYHVGPPPDCRVNATRRDGTCLNDCRPGGCH